MHKPLAREKRAFDQVLDITKQRFKTGEPLTNSQKQALSHALTQLNLAKVSPVLERHNQTIHAPFLKQLLAELEVLQQSGQRNMRVLSLRNMEKSSQIFNALCERSELAIASENRVGRRLIFERLEFAPSNLFRARSEADIRSFLNLSFVFFILLGVISLIVFCWKAYVLGFPILKNRKFCEIRATLKVNEFDISGHITIVGPAGSRFIATDQEQHSELIAFLKTLDARPKVRLAMRNASFPVSLQIVSEGHCVTYFEETLDRVTLRNLLATSIIPTRYAPKTKLRPNVALINPKFATPSFS